MKVKDLIEKLSEFDGDAEVHFAYQYGDHCRTVVAPKVKEVDELTVVWSEYHRMPRLDDGEEDDKAELAVILMA